jgi:hypothetical protein
LRGSYQRRPGCAGSLGRLVREAPITSNKGQATRYEADPSKGDLQRLSADATAASAPLPVTRRVSHLTSSSSPCGLAELEASGLVERLTGTARDGGQRVGVDGNVESRLLLKEPVESGQ